jgi:replication-associated recombination protein RarA
MMTSLLFPELAPLPGFDFPQPLAERYRPRTIDSFAGLTDTRKSLAGYVQCPRDGGFLFCGPAGTGKTSMGMALATELRAFIHHVPAQECTIERVRDIAFSCHYFPPTGFTRHLVLVDEADLMSKPAQNALLSYLDGTNTIPNTTWVFTCNATDRLEERFMSRNRQLSFSTYGIQPDAAKLLEKVWRIEAPAATMPNVARIIKEQNGNIRAALSILESKIDSL